MPTPVRFEHRETGFGIGTGAPRLSWQLPTAPPGFAATAYELELTDLDTGAVEFRRIESTEQVLVPWPFPPLPSRARASVRVRVASGAEHTRWSEPATVETTLLAPQDWSARFVAPRTIGRIGDPAPLLRGRVRCDGGIVRARLHVTALGLHVTRINGVRVTDEELAPGWTSYAYRLRFRTHDVTHLLRPGDNEIEVLLGNGWYRGRLGWGGRRALYGDRLAALLQLEVTESDGAVSVFGTDGSWTARPSGVLADDLYDGQTTDLRGAPDASDRSDDAVVVVDEDLSRLVAPLGPPVRAVATVPAVAVSRSPSGAQLVDFGENLVGWVRLRVRGAAPGAEVVVRHAEVLEHGELGTRPLRSAQATDRYLLAGGDEEVLEPSLTFHGFRYAEISGAGVRADDVEAVVLSSDLRPTGRFSCSEPDLERLHANVVRSMRGNFLDVPTDCPQRDERLGWTGDIQVFAPTATFLADSAGFLASWLRDLAADQLPDGSVPFVAPDVLGDPAPAAAAWGDAATVVPWTLYQRYGDTGVLADQFDSMRAWVDRQAELAGEDRVWSGGFQFGDWLDPTAPPAAPWDAATDPDVVATAHLVRSAEIVAAAADVLGRAADARRYGDLAAEARAAFAREYVTPGGRLLSDAPTAYAMALVWDLLAPGQRAAAGRRLADLVRSADFRIATGFVGTPLITDALVLAGEPETAYRLLLQRGCPSWLYPVSMGATTVWERWDSMLLDGTINPGEMTSFNHYALGAVADWLHRTVAGLAPSAPGYREIVVRPVPGGGLTAAAAELDTPYGHAAVAWRRADGRLRLDVDVPVGAHALVHVPGAAEPEQVEHGHHSWDVAEPAPRRRPLRTVRDAVDDPAVWAAVAAVVAEFGIAADTAPIDIRVGRYLDRPVAELARALAPPGLVPHAATLHERIAAVLAEAADRHTAANARSTARLSS
jgi:alpha-L-rhamnosidase